MLLDFGFGEGFTFFLHFGVDIVEVIVEVFEDHVELFGYVENFLQFDDV